MRRALVRWSVPILGLLLALPAVYGQSATQAVLTGQIVDKEGNPMPGVTVTAHSRKSGMQPAGSVTDANGRYRISPLTPADDYVLVAELPGFAKLEFSPIDLDPGKTTTQNVTLMASSETTTTVQVVARGDIIDVASTKTATVFNSEFIEGLPILGRTYQDILTLAPGVTDTDGDGNPNVNGARASDFQTRVDGVNTSDPLTGTFGQNLNLDSIAEIEVITTGASAEFSQAQGGFANILTKSGGNDFEGSFKMFFRSDLFDNDGANNNDIRESDLFAGLDGFTDFRPFLTVGGPLVKDKAWYFASLQYINQESPVNTLTFPVLRTIVGWNNFGKITYQPSPAHRLALSVNWDPATFTGFNLETGVAPESDFIFDQGGTNITARWTYNISPKVLLETALARLDTGIALTGITKPDDCIIQDVGGELLCNPFTEDLYTINIVQGTIEGPYFLTQDDTRLRDTIRADLSFFIDDFGGTHNLKTGFEFSREAYTNDLQQDPIRVDDVLAGAGVLGGAATAGETSGSIQFQRSFPNVFGGKGCVPGPDNELVCSQVASLEADKDNYGFYVQDSYKPRPNLTLNIGLRFDREEATTSGWEVFEPMKQAEAYLEGLMRASGRTFEDVFFDEEGNELAFGTAYTEQIQQPLVKFDINGDGKDDQHCRIGLDVYTNSTVTDFVVNENGTYTLVGLEESDGVIDNFFNFLDGDFDGTANFGDPDDLIGFFPGGGAPISDGVATNPNCDFKSEDVEFLFEGFARHQLDLTEGPVFFPDFTPTSGARLPGTLRAPEQFDIISNNLAPRLSVSWDPWANNKTKLFATWGRFYDKLFLNVLVPELGPDPRNEVFSADQATRGLGAAAQPLQTGRFSTTQVDRDLSTPFTDEFTIGFERELAPEWSLGFTYIKRKGRDQLQDIDLNHFVEDRNGDGILDDNFGRVGASGCGEAGCGAGMGGGGVVRAPDGQPDLFAWNPLFNQILRVGNFNSSEFQSFQLTVTRRLSRQWQMTGSYVLAEALGDAEAFNQGLGNDPGTVEDEFGFLSFDQTHRVLLSAVSFLPGDQSIGGIIEWASGLPFSTIRIQASGDIYDSFSLRQTYPTQQRNDQRNEGIWNISLNYKKNFTFGKNHASVGVEVTDLLNSDDLRILSIDQGRFLGLNSTRQFGRQWQLSFEVHF